MTSTKSPPPTPLDVANLALTAARLVRGEWLHLLATGSVAVADLLVAAAEVDGAPLRKLRLAQVLASQEDWSLERARHVVEMTVRNTPGRSKPKRQVTVGWLLDPMSDGRRLRAFAEAMASLDADHLDRFPYQALAVAR